MPKTNVPRVSLVPQRLGFLDFTKSTASTELTLVKTKGWFSLKSGSGTKPGGGECLTLELNEMLEECL